MTPSDMRRVRDLLIRSIPTKLAVELGIRILSPSPDLIPTHADTVEVGGGPPLPEGIFRPRWQKQDPAKDPTEPYGNESDSRGYDHGWANCNMVSAAVLWCYHKHVKEGPYGGDMRHHQDDLDGGTDIWDAQTAWDRYGGQWLDVRNGEGWEGVKRAREEGRAILIQGGGNGHDVPGSGSFAGYHACVIGCEKNTMSDGSVKWLFGDPLVSDWQFIKPAAIREWAEALSTGIYFGVSKPVPNTEIGPDPDEPPPPSEPDPEPCDPCAQMDKLSEQIADLTATVKNA